MSRLPHSFHSVRKMSFKTSSRCLGERGVFSSLFRGIRREDYKLTMHIFLFFCSLNRAPKLTPGWRTWRLTCGPTRERSRTPASSPDARRPSATRQTGPSIRTGLTQMRSVTKDIIFFPSNFFLIGKPGKPILPSSNFLTADKISRLFHQETFLGYYLILLCC